MTVLRNLLPVLFVALLTALGLWKAQNAMIKGFIWFGRIVVIIITIGLAEAFWRRLQALPLFRA